MVRIDKKALIALLGVLVCIIIFSEYSNGSEKRSFFTLSTTENATVEYFPIHYEDHVPPLSTILPKELSELELEQWIEQEEHLEQLKQKGQAVEQASIPASFIEQNQTLAALKENAAYYPVEETLDIPIDSFISGVDPSRNFFKNVSLSSVPFHLSGFWILEKESEDDYSELFLQGTLELDELTAHSFKQLMQDRKHLAFYSGISPLKIRVEYESYYGSSSSTNFFQSYFIAPENETYHFLFQSYFVEAIEHRILLPTEGKMRISFQPADLPFDQPDDQKEAQASTPVSIPIKKAPGLGFDLNTTLQLSPTQRLHFEQAFQYDDFILFVASLNHEEHELFVTASFLWSDGRNTYRAHKLSYPMQDKILFVTNKNPHIEHIDQIMMEQFEATFLHTQQVKIPLQKLKEEHLISYLGKSISVTELIEEHAGALPKIKIRVQEQEARPFQGPFKVEYDYHTLFSIVRESKTDKMDKVIFHSSADPRKNHLSQEEIQLSFQNVEAYMKDIVWLPNAEDEMDFDQYTYDLYLPMFKTEIKQSKSIALPIKRTKSYYEPR